MTDPDNDDFPSLTIPSIDKIDYLLLLAAMSGEAVRRAESDEMDAMARLMRIQSDLVETNSDISREYLTGLPDELLVGNTSELYDYLGLTVNSEGTVEKDVSDDAVDIEIE